MMMPGPGGINDPHAAAMAGVGGGIAKHNLMAGAGPTGGNPTQSQMHGLQQHSQRNILSGNGGLDMNLMGGGNPGGLMSAYLTDDGRPPPPPHSNLLQHNKQSGTKDIFLKNQILIS